MPVISQIHYKLPDKFKEPVKQELDELLQAGIIEVSDSHWASPLVPVPKPNDKASLLIVQML